MVMMLASLRISGTSGRYPLFQHITTRWTEARTSPPGSPSLRGEAVSSRRLVIFQCFNCRFDFLDGDICIQIRLGGELRNSSSYCQCVGCVERCGI